MGVVIEDVVAGPTRAKDTGVFAGRDGANSESMV
jgi:hypothetical protein